jgi:glucose/arabinose dehydrogenase
MKLFNKHSILLALCLCCRGEISYGQFLIDTLAQAPEIGFPVCLTFPPDRSNRIFFTEKNNGRVRIIRNDTLLPEPYVTVSVTGSGEQGLLGLTFHPEYPDSPYFYIYYTRPGDRANQLVRYREVSGIATTPETLMVVPRLTAATNHNGGNIHFGTDGKLYVTIGEYAVPTNAQDTSNVNKRGKIHRLNYDGTIPSDNPFPGNTLYVYGVRNSFDFFFDPLSGRCYATENGPSCDDEINLIEAGGNYGWPNDGNCTYSGDPQYKKPLYYWFTNLPAVTGICVYHGKAFPQYEGKLFVASYNDGALYFFTLNTAGDSIIGGPTTLIDFNSGLNDVEVDERGYIYLTNGTYGGASRIFRLRPTTLQTPTLVSPSNGALYQPLAPTLVWNSTPLAALYRLQVSEDSLFSTTVFDDSSLTDTTVTMSGLSEGTKYYWRVSARRDDMASSWSDTWHFFTFLVRHYEVQSMWNIISLPLLSSESRKDSLFPSSISAAYAYIPANGYVEQDTLRPGIGYWLKFPAETTITLTGSPILSDTLEVFAGWNLIGSLSESILTASITTIPPNIRVSSFFSYNSGYTPSDTLLPMRGYWVKMSENGQIVLPPANGKK